MRSPASRASADLSVLDDERRASGEWSDDADVVREWSADRSECRIVAVSLEVADLAAVIEREKRLSDTGGYELEWKTYAHDGLTGIEDHLARFGFEPDPVEAVLLRTDLVAPQTTSSGPQIRVVTAPTDDLSDVLDIWTVTGRRNLATAADALREQLADGAVSVHVAYENDEAASCGRLLHGASPHVSELAGGATKPAFRRHGLYSALVDSRLVEAFGRGATHVFVDALPTSAPILGRLDFREVTTTTPWLRSPS